VTVTEPAPVVAPIKPKKKRSPATHADRNKSVNPFGD